MRRIGEAPDLPWTVREVATLYRVQPPAVRAWAKAGKMKPMGRRKRREDQLGPYLFEESEVVSFGALREQESAGVVVSGDIADIINAELRKVRGA